MIQTVPLELHYWFFLDGEKRYMLAPNGLKVGQKVESGTGGGT